MEQKKEVVIIGAGLVGSLWAVYMSKAGYNVTIYERRSDIRKAEISAGKSINLALSVRGWTALDAVGIGDEIRKIGIPMYGRMMHDLQGNLTYQPYGKEGQAIYSISRGRTNAVMMDMAEKHGDATIHYNHECKKVDLKAGIVTLTNTLTNEEFTVQADLASITVKTLCPMDTARFYCLQMKMYLINWIKMPCTFGQEGALCSWQWRMKTDPLPVPYSCRMKVEKMHLTS